MQSKIHDQIISTHCKHHSTQLWIDFMRARREEQKLNGQLHLREWGSCDCRFNSLSLLRTLRLLNKIKPIAYYYMKDSLRTLMVRTDRHSQLLQVQRHSSSKYDSRITTNRKGEPLQTQCKGEIKLKKKPLKLISDHSIDTQNTCTQTLLITANMHKGLDLSYQHNAAMRF